MLTIEALNYNLTNLYHVPIQKKKQLRNRIQKVSLNGFRVYY